MCFVFKQKMAYEMRMSYWSSDVCSSDLVSLGRSQSAANLNVAVRFGSRAEVQTETLLGDGPVPSAGERSPAAGRRGFVDAAGSSVIDRGAVAGRRRKLRSEKGRVGKECDRTGETRCWPPHKTNQN